MMTPHRYFTTRKQPPVKSRRRKRWLDTYGRILLGLGVLLQFLQEKTIIVLFPESWHPYIAGASAALALVVGADYVERRKDYAAYLRRINEQSGKDTGT